MSFPARVRTSLLIVLLLTCAAPVPGDSAPDEFDDAEMGGPGLEAGEAWKTLNRGVRDRFENDYRTSRDMRALFDRYVAAIGGAAVLDYLELNNPRCHGEAHDLGNAIYAHTKDINTSLGICGNRCTNACMHGVVKEAFGTHNPERLAGGMNEFCEEGEMARLHKPGNCAHGMGHALMLLSGHDLEESLSGCSGFAEPGMDYYCATGVFMEYRDMLRVRERAGNPVSRPSLHYPCDTVTSYPAACYRYMIRRIARETDSGHGALVEECLGLEGSQRAGCFHGLGAMYSRKVADDPDLFRELCLQGNRSDQVLCIEGVIEKMADFDERTAMMVCSTLDPDHRSLCESGAQEKMYRLDKPTMHLYRQQASP